MRAVAPLLLVLTLCVAALAATTAALEPLASAVQTRLQSLDPHSPRERRDHRVLERIARTLDRPTTSLAGDLMLARGAARRIARGLRGDAELTAFADGALDDLATLAASDRDRLAAWSGHLPDAGDEPRLALAIAAVDRRLQRAASRTGAAGRAAELARACRLMDATRGVLGIPGDPPAPPAPMPDFLLADVNPVSTTYGQEVSPRDYLGKVSAWYFGKAG